MPSSLAKEVHLPEPGREEAKPAGDSSDPSPEETNQPPVDGEKPAGGWWTRVPFVAGGSGLAGSTATERRVVSVVVEEGAEVSAAVVEAAGEPSHPAERKGLEMAKSVQEAKAEEEPRMTASGFLNPIAWVWPAPKPSTAFPSPVPSTPTAPPPTMSEPSSDPAFPPAPAIDPPTSSAGLAVTSSRDAPQSYASWLASLASRALPSSSAAGPISTSPILATTVTATDPDIGETMDIDDKPTKQAPSTPASLPQSSTPSVVVPLAPIPPNDKQALPSPFIPSSIKSGKSAKPPPPPNMLLPSFEQTLSGPGPRSTPLSPPVLNLLSQGSATDEGKAGGSGLATKLGGVWGALGYGVEQIPAGEGERKGKGRAEPEQVAASRSGVVGGERVKDERKRGRYLPRMEVPKMVLKRKRESRRVVVIGKPTSCCCRGSVRLTVPSYFPWSAAVHGWYPHAILRYVSSKRPSSTATSLS
jgi:hypothetical protein